MLKWYISKENALRWEGYDDDTLLYTVTFDEVDAWEWIYLPEAYGFHGYDTEDEAMTEAEADYAKNHLPIIGEEEAGYTLEEIEEIIAEAVYEEGKEAGWLV